MSTCECGFDYVGDPGRYVQTTRNRCELHDSCESCGEGAWSGVAVKIRADGHLYCDSCAEWIERHKIGDRTE